MGSMVEARRAGAAQASAATTLNRTTALSRTRISRELPSAHWASTLLRAKVSRTPAAKPLPTLTTVEANTTRRTCPGCAPESHANAELVRPLLDRERDHAIKARGRERESQNSEGTEEPGNQMFLRPLRLILNPVLQVLHLAADLLVGID